MCPRGDETIIEILRMKTAAVAEQSAPAVTKGQRQDMHEQRPCQDAESGIEWPRSPSDMP